MPLSIKTISRYRVFTRKGKYTGKVVDALFSPEGARVCGLMVQPPRLFFVWDRKERFLAMDRALFFADDEEIRVDDPAGAWGKAAERRLGIDWEQTVVWMGMPARSESGVSLGTVRDGLFDPKTGEILALGLSKGATADAAVGVRDIARDMVKGFDGTSVVVSNATLQVETSGGAAAAAGRGAAVAKKQLTDAATTAVSAGKAAARVVRESESGKKAMGWLRGLRDEIVDAMGEDDED